MEAGAGPPRLGRNRRRAGPSIGTAGILERTAPTNRSAALDRASRVQAHFRVRLVRVIPAHLSLVHVGLAYMSLDAAESSVGQLRVAQIPVAQILGAIEADLGMALLQLQRAHLVVLVMVAAHL